MSLTEHKPYDFLSQFMLAKKNILFKGVVIIYFYIVLNIYIVKLSHHFLHACFYENLK